MTNPRPSGHTEIKYYNLKDHHLHPQFQPPEFKIIPRFPKNLKSGLPGDHPGAPFYPKDARYNDEGMDQNSSNGSILPNAGLKSVKDIINDRNRIASGGSKRGRLEDSFPEAKRRRMSNT